VLVLALQVSVKLKALSLVGFLRVRFRDSSNLGNGFASKLRFTSSLQV
jgi:hypothetical protein